jgi:hypothetical protein
MSEQSGGNYRLTLFMYQEIAGILYAAGSAGQSLAAGATSHAWSIPSIENYTPELDTLVKTDRFEADQKVPGLMFGSNRIKGFTARITDRQTAIMAALQGTTVDSATNTEFDISTDEADAGSVVLCGGMLAVQTQDLATGALKYTNIIWPRLKAVFSKVKGTSQAMDTWDIVAQCQRSLYTPWGSEIADLAINAPDGKVSSLEIVSDYPLHLTTLKGNTGVTTFNTLYRPASTVVTAGATPNWFFRAGVSEALTSIVQNSGLATMSAAGSVGAANVLLYGVQPRFVLAG